MTSMALALSHLPSEGGKPSENVTKDRTAAHNIHHFKKMRAETEKWDKIQHVLRGSSCSK